ncbi:MAG: ATP-binding cassette domain-containing protein [candidate division Zixibacteria bacterium]|nr:ATP-binding cassette domain-containing protein [Gammaproteobacteria bacterium]NIX55985.1 ATP-binding cassette domain-containing protein [candidate division Zixibacteria bacterium]
MLLETKNLSKFFGGLRAVDDVTLQITKGGLQSLIGPNGAGKTTYLNLISGVYEPTAGKIYYRGEDITDLPSHRRAHIGIGRSYQITNIFPTLTVLENIRLAAQALGKDNYKLLTNHTKFPLYTEKAMQTLEIIGLEDRAGSLASALNHGDKRRLEIGMLLAQELDLLLLDEPTAGLGTDQVPEFMEIIKSIALEPTKTVILVEHNMNVVMNLSDRIIVMHQGKMLAEGTPEEIAANEIVQEAYLGGLYEDFTSNGTSGGTHG